MVCPVLKPGDQVSLDEFSGTINGPHGGNPISWAGLADEKLELLVFDGDSAIVGEYYNKTIYWAHRFPKDKVHPKSLPYIPVEDEHFILVNNQSNYPLILAWATKDGKTDESNEIHPLSFSAEERNDQFTVTRTIDFTNQNLIAMHMDYKFAEDSEKRSAASKTLVDLLQKKYGTPGVKAQVGNLSGLYTLEWVNKQAWMRAIVGDDTANSGEITAVDDVPPVKFSDSTWRIEAASNHGKLLTSYLLPDKTTTGRFILVCFSVENLSKEPISCPANPILIGDRDQKFTAVDWQKLYIEPIAHHMRELAQIMQATGNKDAGTFADGIGDGEQLAMQTIQPGVRRYFMGLYEIPDDAQNLSLLASAFTGGEKAQTMKLNIMDPEKAEQRRLEGGVVDPWSIMSKHGDVEFKQLDVVSIESVKVVTEVQKKVDASKKKEQEQKDTDLKQSLEKGL